MQELSVPDSELPQRCATFSALFDNLVAILWDTAQVTSPDSSQCPSPQTPATVVDGRLLPCTGCSQRSVERLSKVSSFGRLRSLLLPSALLPPFGSHNPPQILEILARRRRPLAHAGPQGLRESYPQMPPTARLSPRTPCLNAVAFIICPLCASM